MNINSPTGCNLKLIDGDYYLCSQESGERVRISQAQAQAIQSIRKTPTIRTVLTLTLLASLILLAVCSTAGSGIYI